MSLYCSSQDKMIDTSTVNYENFKPEMFADINQSRTEYEAIYLHMLFIMMTQDSIITMQLELIDRYEFHSKVIDGNIEMLIESIRECDPNLYNLLKKN